MASLYVRHWVDAQEQALARDAVELSQAKSWVPELALSCEMYGDKTCVLQHGVQHMPEQTGTLGMCRLHHTKLMSVHDACEPAVGLATAISNTKRLELYVMRSSVQHKHHVIVARYAGSAAHTVSRGAQELTRPHDQQRQCGCVPGGRWPDALAGPARCTAPRPGLPAGGAQRPRALLSSSRCRSVKA